MLHGNAAYWKPVQSGLEEKDIDRVRALTGFDNFYFYPSTYELKEPLSPHESARREGTVIEPDTLRLPTAQNNLVVEGAGGLMVPIVRDFLIIDLIKQLDLSVLLTCRSTLGTINHTLLSIEALKQRDIKIEGLIISGPSMPHNRQALEEYSGLDIIAEIPYFDPLTKEDLLSIKPEKALSFEDKNWKATATKISA
jgi:dethiobiotin synthetase